MWIVALIVAVIAFPVLLPIIGRVAAFVVYAIAVAIVAGNLARIAGAGESAALCLILLAVLIPPLVHGFRTTSPRVGVNADRNPGAERSGRQ